MFFSAHFQKGGSHEREANNERSGAFGADGNQPAEGIPAGKGTGLSGDQGWNANPDPGRCIQGVANYPFTEGVKP